MLEFGSGMSAMENRIWLCRSFFFYFPLLTIVTVSSILGIATVDCCGFQSRRLHWERQYSISRRLCWRAVFIHPISWRARGRSSSVFSEQFQCATVFHCLLWHAAYSSGNAIEASFWYKHRFLWASRCLWFAGGRNGWHVERSCCAWCIVIADGARFSVSSFRATLPLYWWQWLNEGLQWSRYVHRAMCSFRWWMCLFHSAVVDALLDATGTLLYVNDSASKGFSVRKPLMARFGKGRSLFASPKLQHMMRFDAMGCGCLC